MSRTTVSFVLDGRTEARGISPATADRVRSAAAELGYAPHRTARLLRAGTSDLVVLAVPGTAPLSALTLRGVAEVTDLLSLADLHLVVRRTTLDRPFHRAWREVCPAAVIGLEVPAADLEELRLAGVPAVSFDVSAFDEAIGTAQARHLLERGHTSLAYAAPAETHLAACSDRRLAAVRRACAAAGAPAPAVVTCRLDTSSATAAVGALAAHPGVSAVCAFDDEHALAVLEGVLHEGPFAVRAPTVLQRSTA